MPRATTTKTEPTEPTAETPQPEQQSPEPTEPTPSEWATRRAALLATIPPLDQRPPKLIGKLAQIMGLIPAVVKGGRNDFHGYNYAKEADLVEAVRPLLSAYGILFWWTIAERRQGGSVIKGEERQTRTEILIEFKFIDGTTGESTEIQRLWADGDDPIDKGIYKAMTGAVKYALMKTFMIATGDDPEADKAADRRGAAHEASTQVDVRRSTVRQQPAQGGRQAEQTKPQSRAIGDLLRQGGVRTTVAAISLIEQLTGDKIEIPVADNEPDPAQGLASFLGALDNQKAGKLAHDLRAHFEKAAPTEATPTEAAPTEAAGPDNSDLEAGNPY